MKILSITAQKPDSTGSGVYLSELVKGFAVQGHGQAVVAGVYEDDDIAFPGDVAFYPVFFNTQSLPFPIAGMSDEMPYESTVYAQMTEEMIVQFKTAFGKRIKEAVREFSPDLILCHHLYLVTALTRELFPGHKVYGFCHNTDLRQMKKNPMEREYIRKQVQRLDGIFALHKKQKEEIISTYWQEGDISGRAEEGIIQIIGTGYNSNIFFPRDKQEKAGIQDTRLKLVFAGKLSEKKGVMSLIRSLSYLGAEKDRVILRLAGGYGNKGEYEEIKRLAQASPYPVEFLGKLSQDKLAEVYGMSDIFILPSFFEGLPLTVIEALACGARVVVTDLPGVREWIEENTENAPVVYVDLPPMKNTDEPYEDGLDAFEQRLARGVRACADREDTGRPGLERISWENICKKIIECV
ncbi:glycosyltransferase family 4 protein [Luxibacter massiliensis]|uniref:glycosyltransferase family 4 protein n=1 Tax=Luxibacter massiliensis TaxID=2219695 RepID=UPI000F069742|nr:glycosyltransferase family 4 protein [Luxibacter massiliensis]